MKLYLILSLCASFFSFSLLQGFAGTTSELVILSEYGDNEGIRFTYKQEPDETLRPIGIGAATNLLIDALYQGVPVLAPAPLWQIIVDHKKVFETLIGPSPYELIGSNRFKDKKEIAFMREKSLYMHKRVEAVKTLLNNKKSPADIYNFVKTDPLFKYDQAPLSVQQGDNHDWFELSHYLLCSYVPIDLFTVYQVTVPQSPDLPFYLFLPHAQKEHPGLHTARLSKIDFPFATTHVYDVEKVKRYQNILVPIVKQLFVSKQDAPAATNRWALYCLGHGRYNPYPKPERPNMILGLEQKQFKAFLKFLDSSIDVGLLFFSSCTAGGKHALDAFSSHNEPFKLSYTVFSDNLTEAPSLNGSPLFDIGFFSDEATPAKIDSMIDWQTRFFTVNSVYHFPTFFSLARKKNLTTSEWHIFLQSVNPTHRATPDDHCKLPGLFLSEDGFRLCAHEVNNLTSVRYPQATWFSLIDGRNSFLPLIGANRSIENVPSSIELVLLAKENNGSLAFSHRGKHFPHLVSGIPGKAKHVIKEIKAPDTTFSDLIHSFFSCHLLEIPKLLHIKKLTCLDDIHSKKALKKPKQPVTYTDVFIFNYVPDSVTHTAIGFGNGCITHENNHSLVFIWDYQDRPLLQETIQNNLNASTFKKALLSYFDDANQHHNAIPAGQEIIAVTQLKQALAS